MKFSKEQPVVLKRKYKKIDNRDFVEAWCKASSPEQVAELFQIPVSQASAEASALRKRGVKLPKFVKLVNEVDELNALIKKMGK